MLGHLTYNAKCFELFFYALFIFCLYTSYDVSAAQHHVLMLITSKKDYSNHFVYASVLRSLFPLFREYSPQLVSMDMVN